MIPNAMSTYRIHRLKAHLRQSFRYAPHVSGTAMVKPRDYVQSDDPETVDAGTPYAAFFALRDTERPLELGDLLERDGALVILKFVGFEEARWVVPDTARDGSPEAPAEATPAGLQ
jgi:hypothetical protein